MFGIKSLLVMIGFIALLKWNWLDACRCPDPAKSKIHMQNIFCTTEYILVGKVLNRTQVSRDEKDPQAKYFVKILNSIRGKLRVGSVFDFLDPYNGTSCERNYSVGAVHFLMLDKKKIVDPCGPRKPTSAAQLMYFYSNNENSYRRNCKCKVKDDMFPSPNFNRSCRCPLGTTHICFDKHALCVRKKGRCEWKNHELCKLTWSK